MIYFLIPARKGSNGMPGKNRILFPYTADLVAEHEKAVIVTTDDHDIVLRSNRYNFTIVDRPAELATSIADMKSVITHAAKKTNLHDDDIIVLLYLTSPGRTKEDIISALELFYKQNASSLVCRTPAKTSPYMCVHENGQQVISHNLYRRQDYPKCYEIRHHVAVYKVSEIKKLNNLLYNDNTFWMNIPPPIDIDYEQDYLDFMESINGKITV
jgi:CMP-N-acetylneuraminic acid synthetase